MDEKKEKVNKSIFERIAFYIIPLLGMLYIRFVAFTSRILEDKRYIADDFLAQKKNFILSFWHGRQFFLMYIRRHDRIKVLISESKDGEYVARVAGFFGLDTIRGSTTRGGARVLIHSIKALEEGYSIGITPDGPKGPAFTVQQGVLALALKSGCPVIPLAYGAKRKKIFNSWDSYYVPYPFNRIAAVYGEAVYVKEGDNFEERALYLAQKMNEVSRRADLIAEGAVQVSAGENHP